MHAFIVETFALPPSPDTLSVIPDTSVGIEDVRRLQSFLSRKPIQSDHNTVIIQDAQLLTLPAQHALLKTLEEPPGNSLIYLVTSTPDSLLPTILSRVQIIPTSTPAHVPNPRSRQLFESLLVAGVGERLKILDEAVFTRDSALKFLDDLELLTHQNLNSLSAARYALIADTRRYLKANCNLKLCLSHLALGLQNC